MREELTKGNRIEIRDFGVIYLRRGRGVFFTNPKNQQRYYIREKIRTVFKPGKELKERLNTPLFGSLDLGTQSFRLCLGKNYNGKVYFLYTQRENVRLGEGLASRGVIKEEAFERGIKTLKKMKETIERMDVKAFRAVGTAVFRKAENAKEFLERAKAEAGIDIEVLSPEEEAELTLKGVLYGLKEIFYRLPETLAIVDVGGGSTEITYLEEGKVKLSKSIDIGAVVLKELFNLRYPLSYKALRSLRNYVQDRLAELPRLTPDLLVITGGTASILGSLDLKLTSYVFERLHGHRVTKDRLEKIIDKLSSYPLERISRVKGMEPGREDIVLPGLVIYLELLKQLGKAELLISEYGILESALLSCLNLI
jgi:exopolyphosphatase/guanosine-5'-triphosphate,3'-diphosphate pyrophosphatase